MFKRLVILLVLASSTLLAGCANLQNIGAGAAIGGAFGAIVGDNRRAVERGAILGAILGATVPVQSAGYQQQPIYGGQGLPPGAHCPPGSQYDGRGCRIIQQGYQQPYQQDQGGPVYQQDPRTCPRVSLGNGRWRCQ